MLRQRLAGAAAILIPVLALFWLDHHHNGGIPGAWLVPLGLVVALIVSLEFTELLQGFPYAPPPWITAAGSVLIVGATSLPYLLDTPNRGGLFGQLGTWGWTVSASLAALIATSCREMARFQAPGNTVARLAVTNFTMNYVGLALSFLFALRLALPSDLGLWALFSVILITKCSDAGAYFVGKSFGRRPMTPVLSPKKTVEGAIGAIVTAIVVACVAHQLLPRSGNSLVAVVLYGTTLAVAGMVGDLMESLVKRDCQRKDSSKWLPGLGGLLDIFDSLLIAAPIGFLWWSSGAIR